MSGIQTTDSRHWILAALVRAESLRVQPRATRAWLLRHGSQSVIALVQNDQHYNRLSKIAHQHITNSSSPNSALTVATARKVVARVLAPADASSRIQVRDRVAICIVGLALLRSGWRTVAVSRGFLAIEMGCSELSAGHCLNSLVDRGWLRVVARPRGKPLVFKMTKLREESSRESVAGHYDLVGALAAGRKSELGVAELMAAGHPAFGYGKLGHKAWLYLVGQAAGVEPETVGQTPRSWSASRLALTKAGLLDSAGQLDIEALDRYAGTEGCDDTKAAAVGAREARVAERIAAVIASRERRAGAAAGLEQVFKLTGRPPSADTDRATRRVWLVELQAKLGNGSVPESGRPAVQSVLRLELRKAGWTPAAAKASSDWALSA